MKLTGKRVFVLVAMLLFSLAGCSSSANKEDSKAQMMDSAAGSQSGPTTSLYSGTANKTEKAAETVNLEVPNKMVIYEAELHLRVKKFDQTVRELEEKVAKYGGYIAQSNVIREGKERISGTMTIRIPQKHFQEFLHDAEGQAAEVLSRNINGQDVTEEYVDLESRLKSKKAVEERLLSFMKEATKTEDLLKISSDLAKLQEEIEVIEGKMKYLENRTAFSLVTISLYENKVVVPDLDKDKLNTWEKTKQQFMKSTNLLLAGLSGLVVFIIGNLPILAIFIVIAVIAIVFFKKKNGKPDKN